MPVTIPIPSEREFFDQRYLTPWSADWVSGLAGCRLRDPVEDRITYQFRSGGTTFTVRNAGDTWVAVVHRSGAEYTVVECGPHERVDFKIAPVLHPQRRVLRGGGAAARRFTRTRTLHLGVGGDGSPRLGGPTRRRDGVRVGRDHARVAGLQRPSEAESVPGVLGSTTLRPDSSVRGSRESADPARCSTDVASELGRQTGG